MRSAPMSTHTSRRLALALLCAGATLGLFACGGSGNSADSDPMGWKNVTALQVYDNPVGGGAQADAGKTVTVNYTGYIYDVRGVASSRGTQFDTSVGKTPLSFKLGSGAVVAGFDQGVTGMKVGGKRMITIPASLAYGSRGAGNGAIPPNAALVFDVELLSVN